MNAFNQVPPKKKVTSSVRHIEVDMLSIGNDEFPGRRSNPEGKYSDLFARLKPGQCIKCEPTEAQPLSQALRKWIVNNQKEATLEVRAMQRFPKDGRGRVWLLQKEQKLRKVA